MPSFFDFQQGSESGTRLSQDASPLLGRFRAVPDRNRGRSNSQVQKGFFAALGGSVGYGYGTIFGSTFGSASGEEDGLEGGEVEDLESSRWNVWRRGIRDIWIKPQQGAVRKLLEKWYWRWFVLIVLPAGITIAWCAIPFPQYRLPDNFDGGNGSTGNDTQHTTPGHGQARVQVNFWFFLFVYYGFYNFTALMWITKLFNIYSLNWWPQSVGFPITVSIIAAISLLVPMPIYLIPESRGFLVNNTAWILWTFIIMAMPVAVAFGILMSHERHLGLRQSLSETQRIFTSSWWTGEADDTMARRDRRRPPVHPGAFDPDAPLDVASDIPARPHIRDAVRLRKVWIPASFVRFMWFCLALSVGLIAYVLGEAYAEIYLRTLPHNNIETIVYVYSWVGTIYILDGLTAWILGSSEGERVGSYPLGWVFKLYFSLTYQTYVRALYARLRSPTQFIILQILSSTTLIILQPISMSTTYHSLLSILRFTNQPYTTYQKFTMRSIFIRSLSENVSMLAFLGQILVLHYGYNKNVYPYFAFDYQDENEVYDFDLTFKASGLTWACEIVAAWIVRRIVGVAFKVDVTKEGIVDLGAWPELLPTCAAVMVHVLQNMVFSIIRLQFH